MIKSNEFLLQAKAFKNLPFKKIIELIEDFPEDQEDILRTKSYYDLKFFAEYFFTNSDFGPILGHTKDPFNRMHLDFFKRFKPVEKDLRVVIRAARGSAKTTLIALIYVLHKVCFGNEKFILLLSSTTPLARRKAQDIHREISFNEKLRDVFHLRFGDKRASKESFVVKSMYGEALIHSQSFNSQIRGIKFQESRLTLVVGDDVVHGEEVFSEQQRMKAKRQFNTDIRQASQPGTNFLMIGTTIHNDDLVTELSRDPTWESYKYPAFIKWPKNLDLWEKWEDIIKDPSKKKEQKDQIAHDFYTKNKEKMEEGAKVLWPQREPTLALMKERLSIGRREFGAEKQMIPYLTGESLFNNITFFYPEYRLGIYGFYIPKYDKFIECHPERFRKFYALDPATGERKKVTQKKTLSKSARLMASRDSETGVLYVTDALMDRKSPSQIIYEMFDLHQIHDFARMGFEKNLFQELFGEYIKLAKKDWEEKHHVQLKLPVYSIWNDLKKEQRIYSVEPLVSSAKILINKHINPDFLAQLQTYPNTDHNDGLDALEILSKISSTKTGFQYHSLEEG